MKNIEYEFHPVFNLYKANLRNPDESSEPMYILSETMEDALNIALDYAEEHQYHVKGIKWESTSICIATSP